MATKKDKIKWELYKKKKHILILWGLKNGFIFAYNEKLIENLSAYIDKDADVIKYKINIVDKNGNIINKVEGPTFESLNGEEAFSKLCFEDILIDSPCLYMMKKELFDKNPNLRFTKNLYHEDFELMSLVLVHTKSVISNDIYGY